MDLEGTIIVRDLRKGDPVSTIRLQKTIESGFVLKNNKMKDEFFVVNNNTLSVYHVDGSLI